MTYEERKELVNKLVEEDNYSPAFQELALLFIENPKDKEVLHNSSFILSRIIEGNLDFQPQTAEQYLLRGISKFYKNFFLESLDDYEKALKIDPEFHYVIRCKALSLTHLQKFDLAIIELEKAIKIYPNGEYFDDIAENYAKINDIKNALVNHEKAITFSSENPGFWYNYGVQLAESNYIEKAIEMFNKAIEINSKYEDAIHNRDYYLDFLIE